MALTLSVGDFIAVGFSGRKLIQKLASADWHVKWPFGAGRGRGDRVYTLWVHSRYKFVIHTCR